MQLLFVTHNAIFSKFGILQHLVQNVYATNFVDLITRCLKSADPRLSAS